MNPLRLVLLPRTSDAPVHYRVVEDGRVAERGVLGAGTPNRDMPALVVVPGEDAACRWLSLPGGRDAQAAAAAGFLLDDQLAADREAVHIAVGAPEPDGQRLAVVVDRARMADWVETVAALGLNPIGVIPDQLLVPPREAETVAVRLPSGPYAVRGPRLALTCEADLLPVLAPGAVLIEDPAEAERLLAQGAAAPPLDLRQGAYAPAGAGSGRRVNALAVLAGLAVLSLLAVPAVQALRHHLAANAAEARLEALAGPGAGEPAARLRARLDRLQAADSFPATASAIFATIESVEGMELQQLVYGEDGQLRTTVAHPNYSDVELLRTALARSGLEVEESSTATEAGRIVSDLIVRPRR